MLAYLDFDEFQALLLDATRDLLIQIQHDYHNRQIYAFCLFHDPLWGFIVPSLSVQGGLNPLLPILPHLKRLVNRTLKTQLKIQNPRAMTIRHSIGREYFERVNMWLIRAQFYRVSFTYKQIEQYHRTMTAICIDVLQALDKRGLFGESEIRDQTIVNLVMLKDPQREYVQHAKDLNPPHVYQRWIEEMDNKRG